MGKSAANNQTEIRLGTRNHLTAWSELGSGILKALVAFLVFLTTSAWTFLVSSYFTPTRGFVKASLCGISISAIGTGAGGFMALMPVGAFFSYYHALQWRLNG